MNFWPQIIPHRDLEHLELLELLLWNSICNWNKYHYMLCFGIFTYYILLLGVKRSWVQASSLGPKSADNRLIVCAFLFCLYLCTETWTPSPKANTIGQFAQQICGQSPQVSSLGPAKTVETQGFQRFLLFSEIVI